MEHEQTNPWLAAAKDAVRKAQWEGAYIPGDDPFVENSRFPEKVGRTRIPTTSEIAGVKIQQVNQK